MKHRRPQTACVLSLGLALLLNGPAITAAHPLGRELGPEQDLSYMPEPDTGPMPPPPGKHFAAGKCSTNPLRSVLILPEDAKEVTLQTPRYYFSKGLFYTWIDDRYEVVPPPLGALIATLPEGFTTITVGAETFFVFEEVFYRRQTNEHSGYEVVPSPVNPMPMPPPPPPRPLFDLPDMVTIQAHRGANRAVPVVLKRNGHRWIGPNGEIYDRLPTEQQLAPGLPENTPQ
ncbi:MAG: DUF6515 family protein [Desulfobulbus sp.]|nr:DUF6515 family protein [Desulfobulbus sp.]